jgi:MYXO-CTERM domain-containing protein
VHVSTSPRAIGLPIAALCLLAALPARAVSVWTAPATEKIRPAAAARSAAASSMKAARNEFEAFQIAVTGAASGVRASATDLEGPGGFRVPLRLYREALIDVAWASALDGGTGPWPDALVPDVDEVAGERRNAFPFDVPSGQTRALWAEAFVPPAAPAGSYAGSVRVTWSGGEATVPVTLTVWPFTLPSTASLRTAFGFSYGAIPAEHGLGWGDAFAALRARYGAFALDHRISLSHVDDGYSDLSHYASLYGPSIDGAAATRLAGARMTAVELMGNAASWASDFRNRGWFERLFQYTCDEPPLTCAWADIPVRARTAKAADPALRTLVTTTIQEANAHGVTSSIDLLVPVINYLDDKPGSEFSGNQRAKYDAFLAASPLREVWGYQSCMSHGCGGTVNFGSPSYSDEYFTGWPTYMIDASAVRNRAMQWLAFRYRLAGELYYETTMAYGHDPWTDQWDFSGNGDGTLFYPGTPARIGGTTHVPIASLRLKLIREGMEDYEYLALLARAGAEAEARAVADALFPRAFETDVPAEALMAAREKLAARIVALAGPYAGNGAEPPATQPEFPPDAPPEAPPAGSPDPTPDEGSPAYVPVRGGCTSGGPSGTGAALALLVLAAALRARRR